MKNLFCLLAFTLFTFQGISQIATKSVSLFKDGSAFIVKSGSIDASERIAVLDKEEPDATFGTMWFSSAGKNLQSVSSFMDTVPVKRKSTDLRGRLLGQKGKEATVYWGEKNESVSGTVQDVKNDHLTIKSQSNWVNIRMDQLHRVDFKSESPEKHEDKQNKRVLQLRFTDNAAKQNISMMYLRKQIGWFPEYRIVLNNGKTADMSFNAIIVNDGEDIINADVNFVVGIPNFKFGHVLNPLSGRISLEQLLQQLGGAPGIPSPVLANRAVTFGAEAAFDDAGGSLPSQVVSGSSKEDLYFYNLPAISSKKGSRGSYNIFNGKVPVSHLYKTQIPANNTGGNYYRQAFSFNEENLNEVWHAIKLENNTKHPWTTAPVFVLKSEQGEQFPISQDKLNYTSVNDDVFVRLTTAPDVAVKDSEKEISRKANDKREHNVTYDLVTIEAKIEIENYKKDAIDLEIKRQITGWTKESSEKWEVISMLSPYGRINKINKATWKLKLGAGEKKTITYTYDLYIRN